MPLMLMLFAMEKYAIRRYAMLLFYCFFFRRLRFRHAPLDAALLR